MDLEKLSVWEKKNELKYSSHSISQDNFEWKDGKDNFEWKEVQTET